MAGAMRWSNDCGDEAARFHHPSRRRGVVAAGGARAAAGDAVVGYLSVGAPPAHLLAVFKQSLAEAGFVEGRNVVIETPSADGGRALVASKAAGLGKG